MTRAIWKYKQQQDWLTIQHRRRRSRSGGQAARPSGWPASGSRAPLPPGWRPAACSAYRPASATWTHSWRRESAARGRLQPPSNRSAASRHRRLITRRTLRPRHCARSPDLASQWTHDDITGYFFIIHARLTMRESLNNTRNEETPVDYTPVNSRLSGEFQSRFRVLWSSLLPGQRMRPRNFSPRRVQTSTHHENRAKLVEERGEGSRARTRTEKRQKITMATTRCEQLCLRTKMNSIYGKLLY